jgi:hypothetical protein
LTAAISTAGIVLRAEHGQSLLDRDLGDAGVVETPDVCWIMNLCAWLATAPNLIDGSIADDAEHPCAICRRVGGHARGRQCPSRCLLHYVASCLCITKQDPGEGEQLRQQCLQAAVWICSAHCALTVRTILACVGGARKPGRSLMSILAKTSTAHVGRNVGLRELDVAFSLLRPARVAFLRRSGLQVESKLLSA